MILYGTSLEMFLYQLGVVFVEGLLIPCFRDFGLRNMAAEAWKKKKVKSWGVRVKENGRVSSPSNYTVRRSTGL